MRLNRALLIAAASLLPARMERKDDDDFVQQDFASELKFASDGASDGVVEGYGAIFNSMDNGGDIILPGAFKDTLAEIKSSGRTVPMLWQHRRDEPIGIWTEMEENERGLKVKGELIMEVAKATEVRALAKRKAVTGLSIGFRTRDAEIDRKTGVRKIIKLDLFEISPVVIPMHPRSGITSVKSDFLALSPREQEEFYIQGGMSRSEAKTAVALNKKMAQRDAASAPRDAAPEPDQPAAGSAGLIMSMRAAAMRIRAS